MSSKVQEPREDTGNERVLMRLCAPGAGRLLGRQQPGAQGRGASNKQLRDLG